VLRFFDLSPNSGISVDPVLDNIKVIESCQSLLTNGSFESGLAGWTVSGPDVVISPFVPASHGANCTELGISNAPGSFLFQSFSAVGGESYTLSFDILALGDPGRTGICEVTLSTALGTLV
jgi:hypothetical protein